MMKTLLSLGVFILYCVLKVLRLHHMPQARAGLEFSSDDVDLAIPDSAIVESSEKDEEVDDTQTHPQLPPPIEELPPPFDPGCHHMRGRNYEQYPITIYSNPLRDGASEIRWVSSCS